APKRLALQLVATDEAPVAGVLRVVAVVAHHAVRVARNRRGVAAVAVAAGGLAARAAPGGVREFRVRLGQGRTVHEDRPALDLDPVTRRADDALDEVPTLVLGVLEHDDVAPARVPEPRHTPLDEGQLGAVEELVHEDVVADE